MEQVSYLAMSSIAIPYMKIMFIFISSMPYIEIVFILLSFISTEKDFTWLQICTYMEIMFTFYVFYATYGHNLYIKTLLGCKYVAMYMGTTVLVILYIYGNTVHISVFYTIYGTIFI